MMLHFHNLGQNKKGISMPWKVGKKTKTKGWQILKYENGSWQVVGHSTSKAKAKGSIRARYASEWSKK